MLIKFNNTSTFIKINSFSNLKNYKACFKNTSIFTTNKFI
jgi:hypothetical protein